MADYGYSPAGFTLQNALAAGNISFNSTNYADKITLFSFTDITRGWAWMQQLVDLQAAVKADSEIPDTDFRILTVVFNYYHDKPSVSENIAGTVYSGMISRAWVSDKIDNMGPSGIDSAMFNVLVDSAWTNPSPAAADLSDAACAYKGDTAAPGVGTFWWGCLIGKDVRVSDKIVHAAPEANAFKHLDLSAGGYPVFDSTDSGNLKAHLLARIKNLIKAPRILKSIPPNHSTVASLSSASVWFSKPVNHDDASAAANYRLNGAGQVNLAPDSAGYPRYGNAENSVTLNFSAPLDDADPAFTISLTGIRDTVPASADPSGPYDLVTDAGANILHFTADTTGPVPVITFDVPDPTNADPIPVKIEFSEPVDPASFTGDSIGIDNCSVTAGSLSPDPDNREWAFTVAPAGDGTVTVSLAAGAAQDALGNPCTSAEASVEYDGTAPIPEIDPPVNTTIEAGPVTMTIRFSEAVSGLQSSGLILTNCTASEAETEDNEVFTVALNPVSPGDMEAEVPADICTDAAGNPNTAAAASFSVTYAPPASSGRDLVLCMDFSGSMGTSVSVGTNPPAPKISYAKEAVDQFIHKWSEFFKDGDRYGLVRFESTASDVTPGGGLKPFNAAEAAAAASALVVGNLTALGAGLGISLNMLDLKNPGNARRRGIILFADGQCNVNPLVSTASSGTETEYSIKEENPASGFPAGFGDIRVASSDPPAVPVHTIGIGYNTGWLTTLANISRASGGTDHASEPSQIWPSLENDLEDLLTEIYDDTSPKSVYRSNASFPAGEIERTETFVLEKGTSKALFCLSWPGAGRAQLTLKKDGLSLNKFTRVFHGNRYSLYVVDFPHFEARPAPVIGFAGFEKIPVLGAGTGKTPPYPSITAPRGLQIPSGGFSKFLNTRFDPEGEWTVRISRGQDSAGTAASYNFSVLADDKGIKIPVSLPRRGVFTGEPFSVDLKVLDRGIPLASVTEASVKITAPYRAYGNIIAAYAPQLGLSAPAQGETGPLLRLEDKILGIPEAKALIERKTITTLAFKPVFKLLKGKPVMAPGRFTLTLPDPRVPGVYSLDISVKGLSPVSGPFQRRISRQVLVLPKISPSASLVKVSRDSRTGDILLSATPKDIYGNLAGPGLSGLILADFSGRDIISVQDRLNGSYDIRVSAERTPAKQEKGPARKNPLRLTLFGKVLYKETLNPGPGTDKAL